MADEHVDAVVIGMGPGGEVVADRLLGAGRRVAVVERELIGGECGYWACIPSKALLRSPEVRADAGRAAGLDRPPLDWPAMRAYRDQMIRHLDDTRQVDSYREQGALVIKGDARLDGPGRVVVGDRVLTADHVVIATGSESARPPVDGLDDVPVWTNREATTFAEVPDRAVFLGGSAVGVELGQLFARLGSRVTIVQRGPRLLNREDARIGELTAEALRAEGIDVRTGVEARRAHRDGDDAVVELSDGSTVRGDVVVLAAGRRPRVDGLGLDTVGVEPGPRGLTVDERGQVADGLWAVGDVTGVALFTHVAKYQARVVAANILGGHRVADYTAVPRVVFADPESAAVGLTADQARERGLAVATAEVDLTEALARPWTYATEPQGRLGVVVDTAGRRLVGAWGVAPLAGEWIHQAALAIRARLPLDTLLDGVAQFPTFSEGFLAALEAVPDRPDET